MLQRIDELDAQSAADLAAVASADDLEKFRVKYMGTKGEVKNLMALLKDVPKADKPAFGQRANALRQKLEAAFNERKSQLGEAASAAGSADRSGAPPTLDITEPALSPLTGVPGLPGGLGREHIITQTINEMIDVFGRMGFDVATGPEVEDERHNFIALNIPEDHPARDPNDNFYLDDTHLLRSQTSTIQIRVMEQTKPPVRVVAMGRVYRPDEHDATHYSMFHQVEGLYVDRKVTMADLKTTLIQFAHAMFGPGADVRLRPSFFPFTEPSAELEVKINLGGQWRWMEIGGCGMVDPNVFKAVGYDPEEWTGFAFGLGIERLAMRKYGIDDIRWLFENDVRFLRQF